MENEKQQDKETHNSRDAVRARVHSGGGRAHSRCTFSKVRPEGCGDRDRRSDLRTAHFTGDGGDCFGRGDGYDQQHGHLGVHDEYDFKLLLCMYGGISLQKAPHPVRRCGSSCLRRGVPDRGDDALELAGCPDLYGLSAGGGGGAAADGIFAVQSLEGRAERGDYLSDLQAGGHDPAAA